MEENACHSKTMEGKKIDLIVQNQLYIYTQQTPIYIYPVSRYPVWARSRCSGGDKTARQGENEKESERTRKEEWKRRGAEEEIRRRPR